MHNTRIKVKVRVAEQLRAEEVKGIREERAVLVEEMEQLLSTVQEEERAFTEEEDNRFKEIEDAIQRIDRTLEAINSQRKKKIDNPEDIDEVEKTEERAFEAYIRGTVSERATNMTLTDNGAVIPQTIANKIIKRVEDICPIYQMATKYNVKGTLVIPYYAEDGTDITMAYANEFTALTSSSGKFTNIELKGFLAGALSKISQSLVNNSQFDIVSFVVNAMAESITRFLEKELLKGTDSKVDGLKGVTLEVKAASESAVTMDEIIDLKDKVKDAFQQKACFIMNSATRTALRKLKDQNGRYLMQDDVTSPFGTVLLGKPVYVSDQMDKMEAGKAAIYYGDFSGLAVKVAEEASVQVLKEKFADEHAIGVIAWVEVDSKVENAQKIAKLTMAGVVA